MCRGQRTVVGVGPPFAIRVLGIPFLAVRLGGMSLYLLGYPACQVCLFCCCVWQSHLKGGRTDLDSGSQRLDPWLDSPIAFWAPERQTHGMKAKQRKAAHREAAGKLRDRKETAITHPRKCPSPASSLSPNSWFAPLPNSTVRLSVCWLVRAIRGSLPGWVASWGPSH